MLSKNEFVKFVLSTLANRGTTSPDDLLAEVETMLSLAPHLSPHRKSIEDDVLTAVVTSVGKAEILIDNDEITRWLETVDRGEWAHWPWLHKYLSEVTGRPLGVLRELNESSDEVIDLLGDPKREGVWDRRGLVVGHVQSGKTEHYTAVAAKAFDAGYRVVIVLSGIHENLRQQTQERVEEVLIGKDSRNGFAYTGIREWVGKRRHLVVPGDPKVLLPDISTLTSIAGDYGASTNKTTNVAAGQAPIILVAKKNVSILKNLLAWIATGSRQSATLVIDDEADHSSVNTNAADPETDPTKINHLIRRILWTCDRVAFVGYTATPYANIFMDATFVEKRADRDLESRGSDVFPKTFIVSLKAPTNYVGPEEVFGREGDEDLGIPKVAPLPMHEQAGDAEQWLPARHKKSHIVSPDLPESLRESLRAFLLTVASRLALGHTKEHMSMLVHVSRFTDVQAQVAKHVEVELSSLVESLRHSAEAEPEWERLHKVWKSVFVDKFDSFRVHPSQQIVKPELPEWSDVRKQVLTAFERIVFRSINSTTKADLDYKGTPGGLVVVAIGGDRLSRGLTLSGLSISYFQRGAKAFDTLMQMGRWFGYRPGYAHLCRVYAPASVVAAFKTVALATEELRREFSRMSFLKRKPTEYGLKIREPRVDLLVTATNKMRRGETVRVHFAESLVSSLNVPIAAGDKNLASLEALLRRLEKEHGPGVTADTMTSGESVSWHHRWNDVSVDAVLGFLSDYQAHVNVCFDSTSEGPSLVERYVRSMSRKGELTNWTVAMFGNRKGPELKGFPQYKCVFRQLENFEEAKRTSWTFRGVALGKDEAIDLEEEKYQSAVAASDAIGERRSRAAFFRNARSPQRGLLLLYPIIPTNDRSPIDSAKVVVGVALSFPGSVNDSGQDYVCNPLSLRELYGDEVAEDLIRDEEEEVAATLLDARAGQ